MNEIRIANYTLLITLLIIMTTFCVSLQMMQKTNDYGKYPSIISCYSY